MPSPESSRTNLENARANGRVRIWRPHSESQRIKGDILWLHETQPELSQRLIARTLHVSQVYVCKLLGRARVLGIEKALGEEAYERFRAGMEVKRQEHFQAAALTAARSQGVSIPNPWRNMIAVEESSRAFEEPVRCAARADHSEGTLPRGVVMKKVDETGHVQLFARTTTGELIEVQDSGCNAPARTAPSAPQCPPPLVHIPLAVVLHVESASRPLMVTKDMCVADQCPSFGHR